MKFADDTKLRLSIWGRVGLLYRTNKMTLSIVVMQLG